MGNSTSTFMRWFYTVGPGLITAAVVFGPSKLTITSKLGALYGYDLLWIVTVAIFFMALFTAMSTRIGAQIDKSLLQTVKEKWGKPASVLVGVGVFLVAISFQAGNSIGVGIALGELTGTSPKPWVMGCTAAGSPFCFSDNFIRCWKKQ